MFLPPLADAVTEQQHQQELDEQQRQVGSGFCGCGGGHSSTLMPSHVLLAQLNMTQPELSPTLLLSICAGLQLEEQQRLDAEAAAVAAAEAAARAVQEEYEASLPDDVKAKVAAVLERETVSESAVPCCFWGLHAAWAAAAAWCYSSQLQKHTTPPRQYSVCMLSGCPVRPI